MARQAMSGKIVRSHRSKQEKDLRHQIESSCMEMPLPADPPAFMDEVEASYYRHIYAMNQELNILCSLDKVIVHEACNILANLHYLRQMAREDRSLITDSEYVRRLSMYFNMWTNIQKHLGMTPLHRARLMQIAKLSKQDSADNLVTILAGG